MTKTQQRHAWKTLTAMLNDARHGRPVDSRQGMETAEALARHWPSYSLTLTCISRRMRELAETTA